MDAVKYGPYLSKEFTAGVFSNETSDCIQSRHVAEFIGLNGINCCANLRYDLAREVLSV
jgi:hypothetical protein